MKRIVLEGHSPTVEETAKTMGVGSRRLKKIVQEMDQIINKGFRAGSVTASRAKKKK